MEAFVMWSLGAILLYGLIVEFLDEYTSFNRDEAWVWPLYLGIVLILTLAAVLYAIFTGISIAISICLTLYYRGALRWSLWRQKRAYLKRSHKVEV